MRFNLFVKYQCICLIISCVFLLAPVYVEAASSELYEEIEWIQLMPQDDLHALLNPPDFLVNIQDGSKQDSMASLSEVAEENEAVRRFEQALTSVRVIESFDKKAVKIPGFMVPLISDEQQRVTEFFIVPYFGACLHMPPPPPNQMIYGKVTEGFELSQLTEPFWFEGVIHIETTNNLTGTSAYGMVLDNIYVFE
jgi:hypothetical protein